MSHEPVGAHAKALRTVLERMPGATAEAAPGPGGRPPTGMMFKVGGKLFAILGLTRNQFVILKSDPHLIEVLKQQYDGVGHRSHLDRRFWISVTLGADVPPGEVERLVAQSYDLVRASLTRKQQAALATADG